MRISERAAAPPKQHERKPTRFETFIVDSSQAEDITSRLHNIIDGKPPKTCALTILAAIEKGILTKPTYAALAGEFPEIGTRSNYSYYLERAKNYTADVRAIAMTL